MLEARRSLSNAWFECTFTVPALVSCRERDLRGRDIYTHDSHFHVGAECTHLHPVVLEKSASTNPRGSGIMVNASSVNRLRVIDRTPPQVARGLGCFNEAGGLRHKFDDKRSDVVEHDTHHDAVRVAQVRAQALKVKCLACQSLPLNIPV